MDKKVSSFDVLKEMSARDLPSLKSFPLGNVTNLSTGKDGWSKVTVAVDNATAQKLMNDMMRDEPRQNLVVLTWDIEDYQMIKAELEAASGHTDPTPDVAESN